MKTKNQLSTITSHAVLNLRTNLRAGAQIGDLGQFVTAFMENSRTPCNYDSLKAGLEKTAEECKQAGGGKNCDDWASYFSLPFGHG